MARTDDTAENQHYVPKLLLRGFASRRKKEWYVYTFDKRTEKAFLTNIRNVAAERGFYDFSIDGHTVRFEQALSLLEHNTSAAFEKVIRDRRINTLDQQEMAWIGIFAAAQHVRTKNFREVLLDTDRQVADIIEALGSDSNEGKAVPRFKTDDDVKRFTAPFLIENMTAFANEMLTKQWVLMETSPGAPFWIGDNPVTMHNQRDFGLYGNIGFAVPGIEIHLPLSKSLTLALWCPTLLKKMLRDLEEAKAAIDRLRVYYAIGMNTDDSMIEGQIKQMVEIAAKLDDDTKSIGNGQPIRCSIDNVMYLNSLQARWADRYVMSPIDEFSLVRRMLADFPASR